MTWHSGTLLNFGGMVVSGDPTISNPGPNGCSILRCSVYCPAYTRRTKPVVLLGIRGPKYFNLDGTLNKDFSLTEKIKFQLHHGRLQRHDNMNYNNPNMTVGSKSIRKIHGYLFPGFRPPPAALGFGLHSSLQ